MIDKPYHLQVVLRENNQLENATINVGYRLNLIEKTPHRYSQDESPQETKSHTKLRHISQFGNSMKIQTGKYDFPIIVNFTATFEKPGFHNYSYFESRTDDGGGGMYHAVSGYSKAIDDDDDDGSCKNAELYPLAKHDFSTLICVTPETQHVLITQGWAPRPD